MKLILSSLKRSSCKPRFQITACLFGGKNDIAYFLLEKVVICEITNNLFSNKEITIKNNVKCLYVYDKYLLTQKSVTNSGRILQLLCVSIVFKLPFPYLQKKYLQSVCEQFKTRPNEQCRGIPDGDLDEFVPSYFKKFFFFCIPPLDLT